MNVAEPPTGARFAFGGDTVPHDAPPLTDRAEGVTAFTAAAPALPTWSSTVNVSPRRTVAVTANAAETLWTVTGGLVTAAADTEAPEFSSVAVAPALSWKLLPSGPLAVNIQVNTCVPPPPTSTEPPAAAPLAAPAGDTDGGSGAMATLWAGAWPSFVTANEALKDCPGATEPGSCTQRTARCAGVCTSTGFQATCTGTARPLIGSVAAPLSEALTRPGAAPCRVKWNVRVSPAATSCKPGPGPVVIAPGPESWSAPRPRPTASTSPELVMSTARSKVCPTLTVAGGIAASPARTGGTTTCTAVDAATASVAPVNASWPVTRNASWEGPRDSAPISAT